MNRRSNLIATVLSFTLGSLVLAHSIASADGKIYQLGNSQNARINGSYQFPCMATPLVFPPTAPCLLPLPQNSWAPGSCGWIAIDSGAPPCGTGSNAVLVAWNTLDQVPPSCGCRAYVIGVGSAGLVSKTGATAAAMDTTADDSLRVSVSRNLATNQISYTVNGYARHKLTNDRSQLKVTVYQNSTDANNGVNPIATASGTVTLAGEAAAVTSGVFGASDITNSPLRVNLSATKGPFSVTRADSAIVVAQVDPVVPALPATTPSTLALIAVLLLGGAIWFSVAGRRRGNLA